jgi:hypothetical protein
MNHFGTSRRNLPQTGLTTLAALSVGSGISSQASAQDAPPPIVVPQQERQQVLRFNQLSDLLDRSTADTRVFVHRSTILDAQSLSDFATELSTRHPNWRVFFIEDATNLGGVEAVREFLDSHFSNSPQFAAIKDSKTGMPSGAFFAVVKDESERAMLYKGMEYYDRVITQDHFINGSAGDAAYEVLVEDPRAYIPASRAAINSIESAVSRSEFLGTAVPLTIFGGGLSLGLLAASSVAVSRRRRTGEALKDAKETLDLLQTALEEKSSSFVTVHTRFREIFGSLTSSSLNTGQTAELANRGKALIRELFTYKEVLREKVVTPAAALIKNSSKFSPDAARQAKRLLTDELIKFDPDSDLTRAMTGTLMTEEQALTADISAFKPWTSCCNEILEKFNTRAAELMTVIEQVATARRSALEKTDRATARLAAFERDYQGLYNYLQYDPVLELPALNSEKLKEIEAQLAHLSGVILSDPLSAAQEVGQIADKVFTLHLLNTAILKVLNEPVVEVIELESQLTRFPKDLDTEVNTRQLIEATLNTDRVDLIAEISFRMSLARSLSHYSEKLQAEQQAALQTLTHFQEAHVTRFGVASGAILAENGERELSPRMQLDFAQLRLHASAAELNAQQVLKAMESFDQADIAVMKARELLESASAFAEPGTAEAIFAEQSKKHSQSAELLAQALAELETLTQFDDALLKHAVAEPNNENAEVNLAHNPETIRIALEEAGKLLSQAQELYRIGQLNSSLASLDDAEEQFAKIDHCSNQLTELLLKIRQTEISNEELLNSLTNHAARLAPLVERRETAQQTLDVFATLITELDELRSKIQAPQRNPFTIAEQVKKLKNQTRLLQVQTERDYEIFKEAARSVQASNQMLVKLKIEVNRLRADEFADNQETLDRSQEVITNAQSSLELLNEQLSTDHPNAVEIDREADKLFERCSNEIRAIAGEIEFAKSAAQEIRKAHTSITKLEDVRAESLSDPLRFYGLTPNQNAAYNLLALAKEEHLNGNHSQSLRYAKEARSTADTEKIHFSNRVEEKAREEQRKAAAEARRAREAAERAERTLRAAAVLASRPRSNSGSGYGVSVPRSTSRPSPSRSSSSGSSSSRPSIGRSSGTASRSFGGQSGTAKRGF